MKSRMETKKLKMKMVFFIYPSMTSINMKMNLSEWKWKQSRAIKISLETLTEVLANTVQEAGVMRVLRERTRIYKTQTDSKTVPINLKQHHHPITLKDQTNLKLSQTSFKNPQLIETLKQMRYLQRRKELSSKIIVQHLMNPGRLQKQLVLIQSPECQKSWMRTYQRGKSSHL
ncbi:hypothetical protein FGO68_gene6170 [Halteria grandinella]|uniref:Uncharacterized protein n=1 Tax=Halteria grandinella TaxID=5974 RepID=A0A8J8P8C1_HALGN|nr:hypothetical protein FGO68_gene6170 [Halteria grandinella]